jgi:AraC-like DNA-binding protein
MQLFQTQNALLKPYVKQIHYFSLDPSNLASMLAIPTGNVFLSLFWGTGEYVIRRPQVPERSAKSGVAISGQQFEVAQHWVTEGTMTVIGFELTPHAIYQFFGVPQPETTGQILWLEDVWCNEASHLYQQVINAPDPPARLALVEDFLCRRILSARWRSSPVIDYATELIGRSNGTMPISAVAGTLGISIRSLERKFSEAVGISPKAYSKVMQFNHAFRQLTLCQKHILDIVAEGGYYDQSHFVNCFRKVVGMSPGQFFEIHGNLLESAKREDEPYAFDSMADVFTDMSQLYVF